MASPISRFPEDPSDSDVPLRAARRSRFPAFLTVLLLLALCALVFYFRSPPPAPPVIPHYTAQQARAAEKHLESVRKLFDRAPIDTSAAPLSVVIRVSEDDLNTYLATNARAQSMLAANGVSALQITLQSPANVIAHAAIHYQGHSANVEVQGTLSPDPATGLRFTAAAAQVGLFPIPPALITNKANTVAQRFVAQAHGELPLTVQQIAVEGNTLVLTGTRR